MKVRPPPLILTAGRAWRGDYDANRAPHDEFGSENPNECILACLFGMGLPLLARKAIDERNTTVLLAGLNVRLAVFWRHSRARQTLHAMLVREADLVYAMQVALLPFGLSQPPTSPPFSNAGSLH